jgi:glucan 1,3-beta-glucosidase
VRIPIGYWAYKLYDNETYTQGAAPYMDSAIEWARDVGLKVWIDLHGAPGSQNGFDNSGHLRSKPQFQQGNTTAQTLEVLEIISQKYAQEEYQDVVVAIELLNEPLSSELDFDALKDFFVDGYYQVRNVSDTWVMIHDAFQQPSVYNDFLTPQDSGAQNGMLYYDSMRRRKDIKLTLIVIFDHHEYQVFSDELVALQPWQHRQLVCNNAETYSRRGTSHNLVVGEWTAAMTDCAPYLNGYKLGARYDATYPNASANTSPYVGSCADKVTVDTWDEYWRGDMRGYIEAQLEIFEKDANGWIFWNFKTENAHEWSAFALLDAGLFPQPLTDRWYSMICSN